MMKNLKVIIDFSNHTLTLFEEKIVVPMHELPSEHVALEITEFGPDGFHVQAGHAPFKVG